MSPKADKNKHPDPDIQAYRESLSDAEREEFDRTLSLDSHLEIQVPKPPGEEPEPAAPPAEPAEPQAQEPEPEPDDDGPIAGYGETGDEPAEEPTEPAPAPEPQEGEYDVDAIEDPALKSYLLELKRGNEGQRQALAKRAEQLRAAKRDRDEAVRALLYQREQIKKSPQEPPAEPPSGQPPAPTAGGIPVQVDPDTGEARIPPEALDQYLAQREQPQQEAVNRERQRMAAANRLVSDVPAPVQERLMTAFHEMNNAYATKCQEIAVQHRNVQEGLVFMHEEGIADEIAKKFDCEVEDLVDMFQGSRDPWGFGHQLTRVGSKYTARWGGGGAPGVTTPSPPASSTVRPIQDHPRSLARKGATVADTKLAADEIMDLDVEGSQQMTEEYFENLVRRYEKENALQPSRR